MNILRAVENQIFRKAAPMAIRYLSNPDLNTKDPLAQKVLTQAASEFQIAPPITIHFADTELMASVWSATREIYVVDQNGRSVREAIAAAVSELNQCPYCITVHASLFRSVGGEEKNHHFHGHGLNNCWHPLVKSTGQRHAWHC